jgi:hypothetical protein
MVKVWPQAANISIEVRGLGAGPGQTVNANQVRVCVEGKVSVEDWKCRFEYIYDDHELTPRMRFGRPIDSTSARPISRRSLLIPEQRKSLYLIEFSQVIPKF